jgi:alpha-L-fucosidase 2
MLLQSHRGRIELFPAIPPTWADVTFTTLRAEGAILVSAERRDGKVVRVDLTSEHGGVVRLLSPWSNREIALKMKPRQTLTLTSEPEH